MRLLCLGFFILISLHSFGQFENSAKIAAMGDNSAVVLDIWAVQSNPANIQNVTSIAAALSYKKTFLTEDLTSQAFAFIAPLKNNYLGINFQKYGFSAYQDLKAGLSYSKLFGHQLSLGIRLNIAHLKIQNYNSSSTLMLDFGARYQIIPKIAIAGYLTNIGNHKDNTFIQNASNNRTAYIGFNIIPNDKIEIAVSSSVINMRKPKLHIGLNYNVLNNFSLRTGLSTYPFKQHYGIGYKYRNLKIDLASSFHQVLGFSPLINLAYEI